MTDLDPATALGAVLTWLVQVFPAGDVVTATAGGDLFVGVGVGLGMAVASVVMAGMGSLGGTAFMAKLSAGTSLLWCAGIVVADGWLASRGLPRISSRALIFLPAILAGMTAGWGLCWLIAMGMGGILVACAHLWRRIRSRKTGSVNPTRQDDKKNDQFEGRGTDNEPKAVSGIIKDVAVCAIDAHPQDEAEQNEVQHGDSSGHRVARAGHGSLLSLAVTMVCGILCASLPPVAVFFGPVLVAVALVLAVLCPDLDPRSLLAKLLDTASRGRLVAMLAAVALYPFSSTVTLSLIFGGAAPVGFWLAFAFAMLCAIQTGIALVLMVASIPAQTVIDAMRRGARRLPPGLAGWLLNCAATAEQHANRRAAP